MKLKPLLTVILLAFIGFVINKTAFYLLVPKVFEDNFVYPLPLLYGSFCVSSLIIVFVLLKIKEISIDNVGYSYLFLTSLKMVVAYLFLRPILGNVLPKTPTEKMNFFIIFIYFLAIETIVTIRILNNKQ
jgi:hypothetical protein